MRRHTCTFEREARLLAGVAVLMITLVHPAAAPFVSRVSPVLTIRQSRAHQGGGAAISPDGSTIVYVGSDGALHIVDVASHKNHVLLKEAESLDVPSDPSFAPDGSTVAFGASGGTWYWPADVFTVKTDGSGLTRVTKSSSATTAKGSLIEHFFAPRYAPDARILVWRTTVTDDDHIDSADLMSADGSSRHAVATGRPLSWGAHGDTVFVGREDEVVQVNLGTRAEHVVRDLGPRILGRLPDEDSFLVPDGKDGVGIVTVQAGIASTIAPSPFPRRKRGDGGAVRGDSTDLTLDLIRFDSSGTRALLHYAPQSGTEETYEVLDVQNLGR